MLYALHYKKDDDEYWIRILKWNRHPDIALLSFLEVNQKFWRIDIEGKVAGSRVSTLRLEFSDTLRHNRAYRL